MHSLVTVTFILATSKVQENKIYTISFLEFLNCMDESKKDIERP